MFAVHALTAPPHHTVLRAKKQKKQYAVRKKNPLTNLGARVKLDPYTIVRRRLALKAANKTKEQRAAVVQAKRAKRGKNQKLRKEGKDTKAFVQRMMLP